MLNIRVAIGAIDIYIKQRNEEFYGKINSIFHRLPLQSRHKPAGQAEKTVHCSRNQKH